MKPRPAIAAFTVASPAVHKGTRMIGGKETRPSNPKIADAVGGSWRENFHVCQLYFDELSP